jgi:hypothetical protein
MQNRYQYHDDAIEKLICTSLTRSQLEVPTRSQVCHHDVGNRDMIITVTQFAGVTVRLGTRPGGSHAETQAPTARLVPHTITKAWIQVDGVRASESQPRFKRQVVVFASVRCISEQDGI